MLDTAIILAGGFGTRLKSEVKDLPKPMAPVNGKPFLEYVLKYCSANGITKCILSVGYKAEVIQNYFGNKFLNIELKYCVEENPLGTGGAINASMKIADAEELLILNGDTFFNVSVNEMYSFHKKNNSDLSIALKPMKNFDRYGIVNNEKDFSISGFEEKVFRKEGNINGGVYIADKKIMNHFPSSEIFSFEKDFLETKIGQVKMKGFVFDNYFIDIGIPEDYQKAQNEFIRFAY
ncbi:D-glycero-D-manno-heptose 1-phosphate guanosyltransferase [Bacteroidota bacterium]|nr:D-glycero-D-manno-heptose 1-phosphate guanosyltransferase [Bacteroidota bacterium]